MGTPESRLHRLRQRGQGNFELAAHKVLSTPVSRSSRLFLGKTNLKQPLILRHIFPVARNDYFYRYQAQQGKKMPFKSILRAVRASFKILC